MNVISKVPPMMHPMQPPMLPPVFSGGSPDDHVTCHMCMMRFGYTARVPLSLNCLHTFCSMCVYSWTLNKTKQKLPCPMCGKITKIDKGRRVQECLPVNHAVLELATMSDCGQAGGYAVNMNNVPHGFVNYCPPQPSPYSHAGVVQQPPAPQPVPAPCGTGHCNNAAAEHSRIYPDLSSGKESIRVGSREPVRPPLRPVETSNCDCKCEKKVNSCCKSCDADTKQIPNLQINIGSARFRKMDQYVEDEPHQTRECQQRVGDERRPGAVTELSVNSSPKIARRMPEVPRTACIAKISSDKCVKCNSNAATVTVTNSSDKSVQRLCGECHAALKEEKKMEEREERAGQGIRRETNELPNNQARTVIKVQSKLEETARCSPVSEPRCKQSCADQKGLNTGGLSVLKLGDNVRSVSPAVACGGNQVVCGPFKSSEPKSEEKEVEVVGVVYSEVVRVQPSGEERVRNQETVSATGRVDIGTVDSSIIKRTSNVREEPRESRVRQSVPAVRPAAPRQLPQQQQRAGRHREYVVRADGDMLVSAEETSRPLAFNPQYSDDSDARSVSDLGLPTVEPVNLLQRATTKEQEALSYNNVNTTASYPTLSAPPRYEEIMGEAGGKMNGGVGGGGSSGLRFGKYGESSSQPGALRNPTGLNVAHDGRVSVVDASNRTVQVFNHQSGECMQLLHIDGVAACCHARDGSLVTGTNKGVDVYKPNGAPSKKVDMGPVVALAPYRNGFVAAQPRALVAFKDLGGTSRTVSEIWNQNKYPQTKPFNTILDVAVNSQQDFIVLDTDLVYVLGEEGNIKGALKAHQQPCGPLRGATSVGVDERGNILVCDAGSGRILLFGSRGQFIKDLAQGGELRARPVALGVGRNDRAYVATRGDRFSEIQCLKYH